MIPAKITVNGLTMHGYEGDYIFETVKKEGAFYENTLLEKWTPLLQKVNTILDIGANLGNHTLYWAQKLSPKKIYAFEPYEPNFVMLTANVEDNQLQSIVSPVNIAVGAGEGYAQIANVDNSNLGGTSFTAGEESTEKTIRLLDIDTFLVREEHARPIDLVKIDTEGFEEAVLAGMQKTIVDNKPAVWIEVTQETFQVVISFLTEKNYYLYDVQQFNMLFLPEGKYVEKGIFSSEILLERYFYYLTRTNMYYKNYSTAKGWVQDKNVALEREKGEKALLQEKAAQLIIDKETMQSEAERQTIEREKLQELLDEIQEQNREMKVFLEKNMIEIANEENLLAELKTALQRLQTQNAYLKNENQTYRNKIARLTDTWYGKLALRGYRLLKKIKKGLTSKK